MRPLGPPSREIVFRVRVVRDVRAKLCAMPPGCEGLRNFRVLLLLLRGRKSLPPGCLVVVSWLSRGQSVSFLSQNGSVGCPVGCLVVVPPGCLVVVCLGLSRGCLVVVCLGLSRGCLVVVSWLSASGCLVVVSRLSRGCLVVVS